MIAIKDMEMPSCCAECNITTCKGEDEPWNYVCSINLKDIDFNETKRAEHCHLVEIVTCKDCKNRDTRTEKDGFAYCPKKRMDTHKDYFCADAERRE